MNGPTISLYGETLHLVTGEYGDGSTAVRVVTGDGEPYATLSTRLPDDHLPAGVFRLKAWSENAKVAAAVIGAGLVTRVEDIPARPTGWVVADAYRLAVAAEGIAPALLDWLTQQLAYITEEAEATRNGPNRWYGLDEAIAILIRDRIERHILTPAEAGVVARLWQEQRARQAGAL